MKCLATQGVFWGKHNLQSLQALVMLGYAMSHSQEQTWVLLGELRCDLIAFIHRKKMLVIGQSHPIQASYGTVRVCQFWIFVLLSTLYAAAHLETTILTCSRHDL